VPLVVVVVVFFAVAASLGGDSTADPALFTKCVEVVFSEVRPRIGPIAHALVLLSSGS
jgi:hypothetical protein